jgi:phospholipid/cholesterol/gamma-HCH transport system ATP-binding protein
MIEFQNVSLAYGENRVLNGLNFKADFHEKIVILGGSGRGKTTILKLLLGLALPDSGRILIDGEYVGEMSPEKLRDARIKFSIVFQEGALFDSLNVKENIAFALREYTNYSEEEIDTRVRELARRLDIEHAIYLKPEELSGGMQRRVAIARSLAAGTPKMMLYDEPTTGLDPLTAANICNLINELSLGEPPNRMGLIAVTHKVTDAIKIAERFIYLKDNIAFDGNIGELINTSDPELRDFISELHLKESSAVNFNFQERK